MKITRINETDFSVVTDAVMSDGSLRSDTCCRLRGDVLRSHEQPGCIRFGGLLVVALGAALAQVKALRVGETFERKASVVR